MADIDYLLRLPPRQKILSDDIVSEYHADRQKLEGASKALQSFKAFMDSYSPSLFKSPQDKLNSDKIYEKMKSFITELDTQLAGYLALYLKIFQQLEPLDAHLRELREYLDQKGEEELLRLVLEKAREDGELLAFRKDVLRLQALVTAHHKSTPWSTEWLNQEDAVTKSRNQIVRKFVKRAAELKTQHDSDGVVQIFLDKFKRGWLISMEKRLALQTALMQLDLWDCRLQKFMENLDQWVLKNLTPTCTTCGGDLSKETCGNMKSQKVDK